MGNVFAKRQRDRVAQGLSAGRAAGLTEHEAGPDGTERSIVTGTVFSLNDQSLPDGLWVAGLLMADDGATKIPFVGSNLPGCDIGTVVRLVGQWESHPEFGLQFRATEIESRLPTTADAIERYLAAHVRGCGPARARTLVETFGPATLETLALAPEAVRTVFPSRRTADTMEAAVRDWSRSYETAAAVQRIAVTLMGAGMTYRMATNIQRHFSGRGEAADVVLHHPYRLVQVPGIGFKTADVLARSMGIGVDDPSRVAAGVVHALEVAMGLGHAALPRPDLEAKASDALGVSDAELLRQAVDRGLEAGTLVADSGLIFLPATLEAERAIAGAVARMVTSDWTLDPVAGDVAEGVIGGRLAAGELSQTQARAVRMALGSGFSILTGRPGSGKTTTVHTFIQCCQALGYTVEVAAPTGKAAARAAEVTGLPARTVHRLLGVGPGQRREAPIDARVVVLDEVSMADLDLVQWLLMNLDLSRTSVLLVGDNDQLPSVGPGRVLGDLIDSGVVPTVELTEIFRQGAGSRITANAHRLLDGQELLMDNAPYTDFLFADVAPDPRRGPDGFPLTDDPTRAARETAEALDRIRNGIRFLVAQKRAVPIRDIQILTPMRRGPLGVEALNLILQEEFTGGQPVGPRIGGGAQVRVGDRVIQTKNDYSVGEGLFNGEQGEVLSFDTTTGRVTLRFDERVVTLQGPQLSRLQLAWAITVHRSQGSEYPYVMMLMTTAHWMMLERALFYTAITRARRMFILIGTMSAVKQVLRRGRRGSVRHTGLAQRVRVAVAGVAPPPAAPVPQGALPEAVLA